MAKKTKLIRNSTVEFLIFTVQDAKNSIEARYENSTIGNFSIVQKEGSRAGNEFKKYRIVQDRLFESDFDKLIMKEPRNGGAGDE